MDDLVLTASFKTERFKQHLVDCRAADHRKVPQVVVECLEKERLLIYSFGQLYQSQQRMLSELSPPLIVYVYATDAFSIEIARSVLALDERL